MTSTIGLTENRVSEASFKIFPPHNSPGLFMSNLFAKANTVVHNVVCFVTRTKLSSSSLPQIP